MVMGDPTFTSKSKIRTDSLANSYLLAQNCIYLCELCLHFSISPLGRAYFELGLLLLSVKVVNILREYGLQERNKQCKNTSFEGRARPRTEQPMPKRTEFTSPAEHIHLLNQRNKHPQETEVGI